MNMRINSNSKNGNPAETFKFEHFDIWQNSMAMAELMLEIADQMEEKNKFRLADLIRYSAMNIPNRIAEGSGSGSNNMFMKYLDSAKRSVYENANLVILLQRRELISKKKEIVLRNKLTRLHRKIITHINFLKD